MAGPQPGALHQHWGRRRSDFSTSGCKPASPPIPCSNKVAGSVMTSGPVATCRAHARMPRVGVKHTVAARAPDTAASGMRRRRRSSKSKTAGSMRQAPLLGTPRRHVRRAGPHTGPALSAAGARQAGTSTLSCSGARGGGRASEGPIGAGSWALSAAKLLAHIARAAALREGVTAAALQDQLQLPVMAALCSLGGPCPRPQQPSPRPVPLMSSPSLPRTRGPALHLSLASCTAFPMPFGSLRPPCCRFCSWRPLASVKLCSSLSFCF